MSKRYTCSVTNNKLLKEEVFRFVLSPDGIVCFDPDFELTGPNVHVSRNFEIVDSWLNVDFFTTSFDKVVDLDQLKKMILTHYYNKMLTNIALAKKSGKLLLGKKQVEDSLKICKKDEAIVIQAFDASIRERFKIKNFPIIELFSSDQLSALLGKEMVKYVVVQKDFARNLMELEEVYNFFNEKK